MSGRIVRMTREQYDAEDRANWSTISARAPALMLRARKATTALRDGLVAHLAVLEPKAFAALPVYDGIRRGKEWEAFKAAHAGSDIITKSEQEEAVAIASAIGRQCGEFFVGGQSEVTVLWEYAGIPCKSRLDYWIHGRWLVDLKTAQDASPRGFGAAAARSRAVGQLAMYFDALVAAGEEPGAPVLVAVEKEPPYLAQAYTIDEGQLDLGRAIYRKALATWDECRRSGSWPGYSMDGSAIPLALPAWSFNEE